MHKLIDLGDYWEKQLNCPIPLGGIVAKKTIGLETIRQLDALIKASIEYSWQQYPHLSGFITHHSQEMSEDVMRQHINLYVNNYSLALGSRGHAAVSQLITTYNLLF
jgi:1,4-dihydroxy-6-naphthoate synthase